MDPKILNLNQSISDAKNKISEAQATAAKEKADYDESAKALTEAQEAYSKNEKTLKDTKLDDKAAFDKATTEHDKSHKLVVSLTNASNKNKADYEKAQQAATEIKTKLAQKGDFVPEPKEKHLYHVKLDKKGFSSSTGEKLFKAYNQVFTVQEFRQFLVNADMIGYEVEILWNPEIYKA